MTLPYVCPVKAQMHVMTLWLFLDSCLLMACLQSSHAHGGRWMPPR